MFIMTEFAQNIGHSVQQAIAIRLYVTEQVKKGQK